jgi:hypothetical protein
MLTTPPQTRITSKYTLLQATSSKSKKRKRDADKKAETKTQEAEGQAAPAGPRAELKLKTYDPESGACLMYRTDQAAEVARLVRSLGRLGRDMAGLPELIEGECSRGEKVMEADVGYANGQYCRFDST